MNLTDSTATATKSYDYDAFGVERNIASGDANPFRYCAEYYDKETGEIYLRARYYNASIGRFTQQDGWGYADSNDPLSLNLYVYCVGNPVIFVDPSGESENYAMLIEDQHTGDKDGTFNLRTYIDKMYGISVFGSEEEAVQNWAEVYKPMSEEYEHASLIFKIYIEGYDVFYYNKAMKGMKATEILNTKISNNVVLPFLIYYLSIENNIYIKSIPIAFIHSHPKAIGFCNNFPSIKPGIYGGDRIAYNLLGLDEMYIVAYNPCKGDKEIIRYTQGLEWCEKFTKDLNSIYTVIRGGSGSSVISYNETK
ncbi:MAG: RHS repeat-associated core domain-containing protein [Oscillospiraceae bacterium]|nr:RHS repeat-associated core domain-containing protein [Oscillospiraceae bacterium]